MCSLNQCRAILALTAAACAAAFLPGCANGPTLNTSAQNTPMAHPEAKVLFVKLRDGTTVLQDDVVDLKFGHKLVVARDNSDGTLVDSGQGSDVLKNDMIQRGSNFSVILNSVWIPEKLNSKGNSTTRDIAAILDIVLDDGDVEPIVVAYQREVQGGHLMNFKNIVVTAVEKWDGVHQPYFRLRILDVRSERNTNTQAMLEQASQMVNTVAGIVPSPYLPAVSKAIEASKFILGNKDNEILLDYRIQFFNLQQSESTASGSATVSKVLDPFYQGNWIAFGRPKEDGEVTIGPEFWSSYFYYDRTTGMISKSGDRSQARPEETPAAAERETVSVPYVSVVIVKESFGVSKAMKAAFKELSQIITSGEDKSNPQEVENLASLLAEYASYLRNADQIAAEVKSVQDTADVDDKRTIITGLVSDYTEYVNAGEWESANYLKTEMMIRLGLDVDALTTEENTATRAPSRAIDDTMIKALQFN